MDPARVKAYLVGLTRLLKEHEAGAPPEGSGDVVPRREALEAIAALEDYLVNLPLEDPRLQRIAQNVRDKWHWFELSSPHVGKNMPMGDGDKFMDFMAGVLDPG